MVADPDPSASTPVAREKDPSDPKATASSPESSEPVSLPSSTIPAPWWYAFLRPSLPAAIQSHSDALVAEHGALVPLGLLALLLAVLLAVRGSAPPPSVPQPPPSVLWSSLNGLVALVRLVVGLSVGVGLGLGFAAHVHDTLTVWKEQDLVMGHNARTGAVMKQSSHLRSTFRERHGQHPSSSYGLVDEQTYVSLMQSAGYQVHEKIRRGQVLRHTDPFYAPHNYQYYGDKPLHLLQHMYPMLPRSVQQQLATLMDYVMRDFCATWCCKLDAGCQNTYQDDGTLVQPAKRGTNRPDESQKPLPDHLRRMVFQLNPYRNVAIMEQLYQSLTIVFGNLATRVENINVMELFLLKATKVLAHTFKTYRMLRKSVMHKHQAHKPVTQSVRDMLPPPAPTEMQMTKEFLLAGKLHRAITFGLDVPSLLFADAHGKECGWPQNQKDSDEHLSAPPNEPVDPDALLEKRLFGTGLIEECEIDYNRVLAHRMVRALLARNDFACGIVSSIVTEILGECVLPPLMSCFCPDYLNSWIVTGLSAAPSQETITAPESDEGVELEGTDAPGDSPTTRGTSQDEAAAQNVPDEVHDSVLAAESGVEEGPPDALNDAPQRADELVVEVPMQQNLEDFGDRMNALLAMTLIDLQHFIDFDDFRLLKSQNEPVNVDWDDSGCREAILRLVLVIEQSLTDGRCSYKPPPPKEGSEMGDDGKLGDHVDEGNSVSAVDGGGESTIPELEFTSLSQVLMEMTSDLDAFEERVAKENTFQSLGKLEKLGEREVMPYKPTPTEQSTLRTLIAAWLHTGQIYRVIIILVQAHGSILAPYFSENAFLRNSVNANGFVRQLKALDGVEILVDTMMVLSAPRLDETSREDLNALVQKSLQTSSKSSSVTPSSIMAVQQMTISSTPRYLDFNRNESFASSLRAERERRLRSWQHVIDDGSMDEGLPVLCHARASERDAALHRELHHIARVFYGGTHMVAIRDASTRTKRPSVEDHSQTGSNPSACSVTVSLLTVESVSARRRIEIPDDDSSFLLRAQPRPLNAIGVHRDQRNHDQSFKCFAATYEEPALNRPENPVSSGKYVRSCLIRYFPIDRTATVALSEGGNRRLDQRLSATSVPNLITVGTASRSTPFLSAEFLSERHLCHRWTPKGTNRTQGILSSSIVEPTDFNLMPRTGKAADFVYRLSLFERPMIELGGKHFTVNDSIALGSHRADASALELSDATLSAALCALGKELGSSVASPEETEATSKMPVEMGDDGYPIIFMKFVKADSEDQPEIKPYRVSFVRAALLLTSARNEAQLQNLLSCVQAGSVKNATRALTDKRLRPTVKVLEYASSRLREKQSVLLRDLKLGVNHIDREQLRRNGLLNPRYPTVIRELTATVEGVVESNKSQGSSLFGASDTMYKIRCQAVVDIDALTSELAGDPTFHAQDGSIARTMREEWVVLRSYDDFNKFHKHLKGQVAITESSGNAGTRLVGAATAAFAAGAAVAGGSGVVRARQRVALIPSLGQASKASLGPAKKLIQKRKEALDTYLNFLLAPRHLLNRCTELLIFLGAIYPLPPEILPNQVVLGVVDPLGRTDMSRKVIQSRLANVKGLGQAKDGSPQKEERSVRQGLDAGVSTGLIEGDDIQDDDEDSIDDDDERDKRGNMIPSIEGKINKVPLSLVRRQLFELLHYLFGFENASFVRNRMLTALKTMSFAVTTGGEFKRMLYRLHCEKLSADAVADWIAFAIELIWPEGEFFSKAAPSPPEELREQSRQAMDALHSSFPDQIRSVLGQDLTRDGLNMLHEMLQNRLVVKSIFYILMDMLWLDVFPELGDVAECAASLDIKNTR